MNYRHDETQGIYERNDIIERTVKEIYQKAFVYTNETDFRYHRHNGKRAMNRSVVQPRFTVQQNNRSASADYGSREKDLSGKQKRHKMKEYKRSMTQNFREEKSNSSSSEMSNDFDDFMQVMDNQQMMSNYFRSLSSKERSLMRDIMRLDNMVKQDTNKMHELAEKIEKLKRKYVNAFRVRNPDLRHFKAEQIKDYTDLLVKESQNLR